MHNTVSHATVLLPSMIFSLREAPTVPPSLKEKDLSSSFCFPDEESFFSFFFFFFRRKFLRLFMFLLSFFSCMFRVSKVVHGALLRSEFNFRRDCAVSWRRIIFSQERPDHDSGASASVSSTTSLELQRTADGFDLSAAACFASSSTTPAWHLCINEVIAFRINKKTIKNQNRGTLKSYNA